MAFAGAFRTKQQFMNCMNASALTSFTKTIAEQPSLTQYEQPLYHMEKKNMLSSTDNNFILRDIGLNPIFFLLFNSHCIKAHALYIHIVLKLCIDIMLTCTLWYFWNTVCIIVLHLYILYIYILIGINDVKINISDSIQHRHFIYWYQLFVCI